MAEITCQCAICGNVGVYKLNETEEKTLTEYRLKSRSMGYIHELFPNVPAWIRSGAIDPVSNGFCICPDCC